MPATVAPSPAAVTLAANIASTANASSTSDGATSGQTDMPVSFAALVKQLAGKPVEPAKDVADPTTLLIGGEVEETSDALAALLPFLEAMGLTRTDDGAQDDAAGANQPLVQTAAGLIADAGDLAAQAAPLAVPLAAPAIPAGNLPAAGLPVAKEAPSSHPVAPSVQVGTLASVSAEQAEATAPKPAAGDFAAQMTTVMDGGTAIDHASNGMAIILPALAQSAAPQQMAHSLPMQQVAAHALPVSQAVGAPGWDREVGNQVAWLANQAGGKAELVLTPPQMGRVEISLTIAGDQASASFVSANPVVREALESALPRLREVLAEAGIQLGQAQVGAESRYPSAQQEKNGDNPATDRATASVAALQTAGRALPAAGLKIGRGLVDVFA